MSDRHMVITGASGFVGANLSRYFHRQGWRVTALLGPNGHNWRTEPNPGFETCPLDITDLQLTQEQMRKLRPTHVVHCAAYGAYSFQNDVDQIYRVNLSGTRNLVDSLRTVDTLQVFIQLGSSSEYGYNCNRPSEETLPSPDSHYAISKVAATLLVSHYAKKFGFPGWTLRLYSAFGPYEEAKRLIPTLLREAQKGRLPELVSPSISRDFIYVDDIGRAIEALIAERSRLTLGEIFNLGSGKKTTLQDLIALSKELFHISSEPRWGSMADRAWDHPDWYGNVEKARQVLGWQPKLSLAEGLRLTYAWMQENTELQERAILQSASERV